MFAVLCFEAVQTCRGHMAMHRMTFKKKGLWANLHVCLLFILVCITVSYGRSRICDAICGVFFVEDIDVCPWIYHTGCFLTPLIHWMKEVINSINIASCISIDNAIAVGRKFELRSVVERNFLLLQSVLVWTLYYNILCPCRRVLFLSQQ